MALNESDRHNFEILQQAASNGDLALVESRCAKTGQYRALVCAMEYDGEYIRPVPVAVMITGNPYEDFVDPTQDELPEPTDA